MVWRVTPALLASAEIETSLSSIALVSLLAMSRIRQTSGGALGCTASSSGHPSTCSRGGFLGVRGGIAHNSSPMSRRPQSAVPGPRNSYDISDTLRLCWRQRPLSCHNASA